MCALDRTEGLRPQWTHSGFVRWRRSVWNRPKFSKTVFSTNRPSSYCEIIMFITFLWHFKRQRLIAYLNMSAEICNTKEKSESNQCWDSWLYWTYFLLAANYINNWTDSPEYRPLLWKNNRLMRIANIFGLVQISVVYISSITNSATTSFALGRQMQLDVDIHRVYRLLNCEQV